MWIFGYGSLIWKAGFPYEKRYVGYIKGYVRRFYQKSTDHRGTPSMPGRVVTLLHTGDLEDRVYGVAYKIPNNDFNDVMEKLDYREKCGYQRETVMLYPSMLITSEDAKIVTNNLTSMQFEPFLVTIYIGDENNPNYAGVEDIDTIANNILIANGPSGPNTEYLYNLASAMRDIAPNANDEHLFTLEEKVLKLEKKHQMLSVK